MRHRLSPTLALLLSALFVLPLPADAAPIDKASTHVVLQSWLVFARAGTAALPTARTNLDAFSASVASDCPNVLQPLDATPAEALNWRVLSSLFNEALFDADIVAANSLRTPFDRFASRVTRLKWSTRANRARVKRSLDLQRRYVFQEPSEFCSDARALAADATKTPTASLQFLAQAQRNGNGAGLSGLIRTVQRFVAGPDRKLLDRLGSAVLSYQLRETNLILDRQDKLIRALGLTKPQEILRQDADAMSNVRNMISQIESCYTDSRDYSKCRTPQNSGLPLGSSPGQVEVTTATKESYVVVAHSTTGTDFTITRDQSGNMTRTCNRPEVAACGPGGVW